MRVTRAQVGTAGLVLVVLAVLTGSVPAAIGAAALIWLAARGR